MILFKRGNPENTMIILVIYSQIIFGSSFYMLTGFHGFHVFLGLCGLIACLIRLGNYEFTKTHHVGLEAAAWYWHFVDAVWIIVFFAVYWWGHNF